MYTTDDKSFKEFLNSLTWDDLMEHAASILSEDYAIELLMEQESNYGDYLLNLKDIETDETPEKLKEVVLSALHDADEETIISLLINFTPEEVMIDILMETEEGTRSDMISNQLDWDKLNYE